VFGVDDFVVFQIQLSCACLWWL